MSDKEQKWPTISIPREDQELVKRIVSYPGILRFFQMQDILLIAASIAVELDAPKIDDMTSFKNKVDVVHGSLLSGRNNEEYRQYILMIYYNTSAKQNLEVMGDLKSAVANFVDYAHRGLQIMQEEYLRTGGPEDLEKMFSRYLNKSAKEE